MKLKTQSLAGRRTVPMIRVAVISLLASVPVVTGQTRGDYGDAPDEGPTHYRLMFETSSETGHFPTLYNTTNGRFGNKGIHHLVSDEEWFGPMEEPPSRETDADDTATDDDGFMNLINSDMLDNGLPKIPFMIALVGVAPPANLSYYVSVPAGAPDVPRIINVLIDWDQDGQWQDMGNYIPGALDEWVIRNHTIYIPPGTTKLITSPNFQWGWNALLAPQCFWMRMTISQDPVTQPLADGWDGSGVFSTGETEDYLIHSDYERDVTGGPWAPGTPGSMRPRRGLRRPEEDFGPVPPPPPLPPPVGKKPERPPLKPDLVILPKKQTVPHGTVAQAHVVKVPATNPPSDPNLPGWAVGAGVRNNAWDMGSGPLPLQPPPGTTLYPGPTLSAVTFDPPAANAPAGTLNTMQVVSAVDTRDGPEDWPLEVDYSFPGDISGTAEATVRVRHAQNNVVGGVVLWGLTGVYTGGTDTIDASAIDPADKANAFSLLDGSRVDFESGLLADALSKLGTLQGLLTAGLPGITPEEELRLDQIVAFLELELTDIQSVHGAVPVPVIVWPEDGDYVSGPIEMQVTHLYPEADVHAMSGEYRDPASGAWLALPLSAVQSSPGEWLQEIDTVSLPDGLYDVRVTLIDENVLPTPEDDRMCQAVAALRIDNTPPAEPVVATPAPNTMAGGILLVDDPTPSEEFVASVEFSSDGGSTWFEMATDYDGADGWQFDVSLLELPGGPYELRITCMDEAENLASSLPVPIEVLPGYLPWREGLEIPDDDADEDRDGIPAILEYYSGLDPFAHNPSGVLDLGIEGAPANPLFHCLRGENVFGLSAVVESSSDLGITDPWTPVAVDPPREPSGRIEVALPAGDRQFGRLRLEP